MENKILKDHQNSMSVDDQIENLKSKGLIIQDEEYAREVLQSISYFRLIKAYSLGIKEKNSNYHEEVTFENIVELYSFNKEFRQILFPMIEEVEVMLRCRLSNYFCDKYDVLGYYDNKNFSSEKYHQEFIDSIEEEIKRNSKAPFVRNFQENYNGAFL